MFILFLSFKQKTESASGHWDQWKFGELDEFVNLKQRKFMTDVYVPNGQDHIQWLYRISLHQIRDEY